MDVEKAIEAKIEPELRDAFGPSVARSLLTIATLSYITTVGGKTQRYRAFVDSICTDERVVQKWGEVATARQAQEWKQLVPAERDRVVVLSPIASD
jgi:hypothetical protein